MGGFLLHLHILFFFLIFVLAHINQPTLCKDKKNLAIIHFTLFYWTMAQEQVKNEEVKEENNTYATSQSFRNPVWEMREELRKSRPYEEQDFQKGYFIPDF